MKVVPAGSVLAIALTLATLSARADEAESMSAIDHLSDCIDDAISYTRVEKQQGLLELICGGAPARRFYEWLGHIVEEHQAPLGDGIYSIREFGPNACGALLRDGSGKRPEPPVFRCELKLDVGGILEK
jgi:hypothetical protein